MKKLFTALPQTLLTIFQGRNLILILIAMVLTLVIVVTGLDAWWFGYFRNGTIENFFSLAGIVGFFVPVLLWVILLIVGLIKKNNRTITAAWMTGQAGVLGWVLSSLFKVFTGRIPPPHDLLANLADLSHVFQFGIYRGGIFWGWPSSHTATAFAMSIALGVFYKDKPWVKYLAIVYAAYIGLGASMSFHWLSDVVAGVILGSVVGVVVAHAFRNSLKIKDN